MKAAPPSGSLCSARASTGTKIAVNVASSTSAATRFGSWLATEKALDSAAPGWRPTDDPGKSGESADQRCERHRHERDTSAASDSSTRRVGRSVTEAAVPRVPESGPAVAGGPAVAAAAVAEAAGRRASYAVLFVDRRPVSPRAADLRRGGSGRSRSARSAGRGSDAKAAARPAKTARRRGQRDREQHLAVGVGVHRQAHRFAQPGAVGVCRETSMATRWVKFTSIGTRSGKYPGGNSICRRRSRSSRAGRQPAVEP